MLASYKHKESDGLQNGQMVGDMMACRNGWNVTLHNAPTGLALAFKSAVRDMVNRKIADGDTFMSTVANALL